jgi:hypothetical protein
MLAKKLKKLQSYNSFWFHMAFESGFNYRIGTPNSLIFAPWTTHESAAEESRSFG